MNLDSAPYAALYVDFENVYYALKKGLPEGADACDVAVRLLRRLQNDLSQSKQAKVIMRHAYADFERIQENAQSALYLIGVEAHNVLGTEHKNAADMRMCIDVMETLYTRDEISTFLVVAGDRDYIPVLQHLQTRAKRIYVVAFSGSVSGDLLQIVGDENFIDAATLVPSDVNFDPNRQPPAPPKPPKEAVLTPPPPAPVVPPPPVKKFGKPVKLDRTDQLTALEVMLENFGDKPEVWVTPYLNKLRLELAQLASTNERP